MTEEINKAEDKAPIEDFDPYSLSPEQLDEIIQKGEVVEEPDETEEAPEQEIAPDKPETEVAPDNSEKTIEQEPTKTEEAAKPADQAVILTQEMLNTMGLSEDSLKLINSKGLVGKPISEFINQYVNAQKLVGKRSEEIKRELFPKTDQDYIAPKQPIIFPKDQKAEEAEALMNKMVMDKITNQKKSLGLADDFEFPPNLDIKSPEYKAWYKTVNYDYPMDLKIFESAMHNEREDLRSAYSEVVRLRSEFKQDNDKIIDTEIEKIDQYFSGAKINLKEYGVEFNDDMIQKLLFVEKNGQKILDDNMFDWVNGEVPLLKKGSLATKFMNEYGTEVLSKVRETSLEQGRREGALLTQTNKKPINKGLGNTDIAGETKVERNNTDRDPYTLSPADLDREISYLMKQE